MPRKWTYTPHDRHLVDRLSTDLKIAPLTAQVLIARGMRTSDEARIFLGGKLTDLHQPEQLPGVVEASALIAAAVRSGRRITIYGDYDVDGVTATAILWHCLSRHNANVDSYTPCRLEEGYGLNAEAIRSLAEEDADRLLITVDCGICSTAEAALAKELGLELIITDHHTPGSELPQADEIVHPSLPGREWPDRHACGAGVAFQLAWAICKQLSDGDRVSEPVRNFLTYDAIALAAVGTVADVVPLVGQNRLLVRYGLSALAARPSIGLAALMKVSGVEPDRTPVAEDVGFKIGPRINAAGRLGQAQLAVELLTTSNEDRAAHLASYLDQLNNDRRKLEQKTYTEAKNLIKERPDWLDAPALVVAEPHWHPGVIGIVASRIAERFERPAILIAINQETGQGQGSGRSFAGFDLHSGINACGDLLLGFGGHRAAAGVRIEAENIDRFRDAFCEFVAGDHAPTESDLSLAVDAEVMFSEITPRAVGELDRLGPFGQANPRPAFVASQVELAAPPRTMGQGDRHLALQVKQFGTTLRAIAFGQGEWAEEIAATDGPLSLHFTVEINRWQGRNNVELRLGDWKVEEAVVSN
ncbi:single-stranded-DNA-specific exonuclease RecJ [Stratiformator vulcanicus]|uniref:Single-stranded-DNA-specific exonuclease RecJ n=1 Tax=Stratiformator vulcanicus TaxID=2527980 RepID=A0A517QZN3_9PLAN|nr:single-stranded-DNA-specific exonuclease RecJ [Stratiformator vulcanicus]QDT37107.1 Single-stranded-DNA-specific exonuclease RecJ [Stratiformator vulcanicus]